MSNSAANTDAQTAPTPGPSFSICLKAATQRKIDQTLTLTTRILSADVVILSVMDKIHHHFSHPKDAEFHPALKKICAELVCDRVMELANIDGYPCAAAAPLTLSEGITGGTLLVLCRAPRTFSTDDTEILAEMASLLSVDLESHQANLRELAERHALELKYPASSKTHLMGSSKRRRTGTMLAQIPR